MSVACALVAFVAVQVLSRTAPVALVFGAIGGYLPFAVAAWAGATPAARVRRGLARGRRQPRLRGPRRAGAARGAGAARRSADPSRCGPSFAAFALDYQVTGRFGECLDRLKDRLADPVGDRVVEGLRIAREVGGGDLGRLLRNLSGYPARRRPHPLRAGVAPGLDGQRRPAGGGGAMAGAADACRFQPEVIARYASPAGVVVLLGRRRAVRRRRTG